MQISTRTEDFVIDTLKLRIHIGPYLREVFKDPTKRKVFTRIFWVVRGVVLSHLINLTLQWLIR